MEKNPITQYPEAIDYLEKNLGTVVFFPKFFLFKGLRKMFIKNLILNVVRQ